MAFEVDATRELLPKLLLKYTPSLKCVLRRVLLGLLIRASERQQSAVFSRTAVDAAQGPLKKVLLSRYLT